MNSPYPPRILKAKKCKQCGDEFIPFRPLQSVCGVSCSIILARKIADKSDAVEKKAERRLLRERKIAAKTLSQWKKETQSEFNKFIRLRDAASPCISCQRFHSGQYHAGHFRTVGACPSLRYEEANCHKQCSACNNHLSGNILEYRKNLIEKLGIGKVEWLEGYHEAKHYTIADLQYLKKLYQLKCKQLTKEREL